LASSISHRAVPRGGFARRNRSTTARPAGSLPCTAPTTSSFTRARGEPTRRARIGRPSAERPITSPRAAGTGAGGSAGWGVRAAAASSALAKMDMHLSMVASQ
jgi:hypothetical protein